MNTDFLVADALISGFHAAALKVGDLLRQKELRETQQLRQLLAQTWAARSPDNPRKQQQQEEEERSLAASTASIATAAAASAATAAEDAHEEEMFGRVALLRYNREKKRNRTILVQSKNAPPRQRSPRRSTSPLATSSACIQVAPCGQVAVFSSSSSSAAIVPLGGEQGENDCSGSLSADVPRVFQAILPARRPPPPPPAAPGLTLRAVKKDSVLAVHDRKAFLRGQREMHEERHDVELKQRVRTNLLKLLPAPPQTNETDDDDDDEKHALQGSRDVSPGAADAGPAAERANGQMVHLSPSPRPVYFNKNSSDSCKPHGRFAAPEEGRKQLTWDHLIAEPLVPLQDLRAGYGIARFF